MRWFYNFFLEIEVNKRVLKIKFFVNTLSDLNLFSYLKFIDFLYI